MCKQSYFVLYRSQPTSSKVYNYEFMKSNQMLVKQGGAQSHPLVKLKGKKKDMIKNYGKDTFLILMLCCSTCLGVLTN